MTAVRLVEPAGRGGVYQHTVALARCLADAGVAVQICTTARPEPLPGAEGIPHRACSWFFPRLRPRTLRRLAAAAGWLGVGIPCCVAGTDRGDVVHVQGWFRHPLLVVPLVPAARLKGCRLVVTPHPTFSRRGRRWEERVMAWVAARADAVPVFSAADQARVEAWGARAASAPFPVVVAAPPDQLVTAWRRRWLAEGGEHVVLLAGQLRPGKGLDTLVRAAAAWGDDLVLAVVGEDAGALGPARRLAAEAGTRMVVDEGYQPLSSFLAALAAADVVACPYPQGSRSAVLDQARALGRPTVASTESELKEWATVVVPPGDPAALAAAVRTALDRPSPVAGSDDEAGVAAAYAHIYGLPAAAR